MLARTSLRLPKTAVRSISSSAPARVLQQTPSAPEKTHPQVSEGEQAWCDIYGVDYEKQIQEALKESPAAAAGAPKPVNYPTASGPISAQGTSDIWNVVFGNQSA
ncbi:hypothetical protein PHYBOEH_005894 [Phytophthora boehmeriae]|uniref:Uncharacterized protein n=1 Tax=Phytophthora boehmeriae TaxID=109152 RepID=A0A8T1WKU8_9STRA|nr:hypothetical protein PHYBOEH_005894 [Phytophthora boehmeriae]